jgi:CrcB protein
MMRFLLVCLGGAAGSGARYLVGTALPQGTLTVNIVGSFFIALALESMRASDLRLMLVTGVLGGFTTYSAFNQETLVYIRAGAWGSAAANIAGTVVACLAAGFLGVWLGRRM